MTALSGFDPTSHIVLVRNPNYSPATDSKQMRANYLNGVTINIDTNISDIYNRIQSGQLDGAMFNAPPAVVVHQYQTNPQLKGYLHTTPILWLEAITMNLALPPFDDIHVRKAVAYVLDHAAMINALGGATTAQIATHIFPPVMLQNKLTSAYNPYKSPGAHGDLAAAQAQMKQSASIPSTTASATSPPARTSCSSTPRASSPPSTRSSRGTWPRSASGSCPETWRRARRSPPSRP